MRQQHGRDQQSKRVSLWALPGRPLLLLLSSSCVDYCGVAFIVGFRFWQRLPSITSAPLLQ